MALHGKTILITRAASQNQTLAEALEALGAHVIAAPAIEIHPLEDTSAIDAAIRTLESFDWILFTSANAVDCFVQRLNAAGKTCRNAVAAVGTATGERLKKWGLSPTLVPRDFRAEGILEAFPLDLTGQRILFPRAETARELLPDTLRQRGATVDVVAVYKTVQAEEGRLDEVLRSQEIHCIVFTSPSTVRSLAQGVGEDLPSVLKNVAVAVIGPVTAAATEEVGLRPVIMPEKSTMPDLVAAIDRHLGPPETSNPK